MNIHGKLALACAAAALVLCSCSQKENSHSAAVSPTAAPSQSSAPVQAEISADTQEIISENAEPSPPLRSLQAWGISWGGLGKEGVYRLREVGNAEGALNLIYLDYATMETFTVCAQPNCTHTDESCTAYLYPAPGGICMGVVGDQLVLFFQSPTFDPSEDGFLSYVECANLDGSDRHRICEFKANQHADMPMLTDEEKIYFRLTTFTGEGTTGQEAELCALDVNTGEIQTVRKMDTDRNERIMSCSEKEILIFRYTSAVIDTEADQELILFNPQNGNEKQVYTWGSGVEYPIEEWHNFTYKGEDGFYHIYDLDSDKDIALTQYRPKESGKIVSQISFDSDHLLVSETELGSKSATSVYYVLGTDGSINEWNLLFDFEGDREPYSPIMAIDETHYLVHAGYDMSDQAVVNPDGTSRYISFPDPKFVVMTIEDFWAGKRPE